MNRNITRRLLLASGGIAALVSLAVASGVRVNTTASVPKGLYRITGEAARKGSLVLACPPPVAAVAAVAEGKRRGYIGSGFCPSGTVHVIKKIVGMPGDRVAITGQGVTVNGERVPGSAPRQADPSGRPMPFGPAEYTLGPSQVLLMSNYSPLSFDGRYFGPVDGSSIVGVLRPLLTYRTALGGWSWR